MVSFFSFCCSPSGKGGGIPSERHLHLGGGNYLKINFAIVLQVREKYLYTGPLAVMSGTSEDVAVGILPPLGHPPHSALTVLILTVAQGKIFFPDRSAYIWIFGINNYGEMVKTTDFGFEDASSRQYVRVFFVSFFPLCVSLNNAQQ